MSFHRENVVWKSSSGTWGIGFFESYVTGDDPEWDVDYNFDAFEWASVGHPTAQDAHNAWRGANPGGGMEYDTPGKETDHYDKMAQAYFATKRSSPFRR